MTKPKTAEREGGPAQKPVTPSAPSPAAIRVAPLFRKIDWLTLIITFVVMWIVYFLTLAPELTLEDSGELVTGSFYAGIPHPPGYPVWSIYSWLWTELVPWGNMAWRVALAEATAGALSSGLIAFMVSRCSSMFMESIEELKDVTGQWENAICVVSGLTAGFLMGLDDFMWRESVAVNRIAVSSVPWFMLVLLCLLRWLYAPHQRRFLFWALFLFGICFTTHQTLVVAAVGVEVLIAAGNSRMGRYLFLGNSIIYLAGYVLMSQHVLTAMDSNPAVQVMFHVVGIASIACYFWFAILTKETFPELCLDAAMAVSVVALAAVPVIHVFGLLLALAALVAWFKLALDTRKLGWEWGVVIICGFCWFAGASFYLYEALSGMTNPPMQWGYPRTVEGFFHALTRGQYEKTNPTPVFQDPMRFIGQLGMLVGGLSESFTWVCVFIALVPFIFFFKVQKRERAFMTGLIAIYFCMGVILVILLNPTPDKTSADLVKVFFNNSQAIVASLIGFGLALTAAFMATHYQRFRIWGLVGGVIASVLAVYGLWDALGKHYFGPSGEIGLTEMPHWIAQAFAKNQYGLPIYAHLLLLAIPLVFVGALVVYRNRAPLAITLGLFALLPLSSGLRHWFECDQRDHMFGYWFGHDMFSPPFNGKDGKPIYPEMTKDAILYGGTDPGRFCPTYMIFTESFTPHDCQPKEDQHFDRRDVYIITQNALADGTYLDYIRAHYNRSTQIDPPFFSDFCRSESERQENYKTNLLARLVTPLDTLFEGHGARVEKRRRTYTSWFQDKDFADLRGFANKLKPPQADPLSKYLFENLSPKTQDLVKNQGDEKLLSNGLEEDLNRLLDRELAVKKQMAKKKAEKDTLDQEIIDGSNSAGKLQRQKELEKEIADLTAIGTLYDPERFKQVTISEYLADFIKENPQSDTRVRLNRLLLEAAYPKEITRSLGGVYPDREMYIATPEDSQRCFQEYLQDAQERMKKNQLDPGEDVHVVENRVQVSGQVAVMNINGLLTKVMFDHNPKNEFFVEESFPLKWMYPYLTPFGVIMKINRNPLPSLSEDVLRRDHEFWMQYSKRMTGDIQDYDTPVTNVVAWIEKTYLRYNLNGFTGDRKFVHDMDAQKAFSKLRSSIGGIYAWRLGQQCPPEYRPKSNEELQRLYKEADFAFRQAFAFCPYSPEAVFRYVNLLAQFHRLDDALLVAQTCQKMDPYNGAVQDLVKNLTNVKKSETEQQGNIEQAKSNLQKMEDEVRSHPTNVQAAFDLASAYFQMHNNERAVQLLDGVLNRSNVEPNAVLGVAQAYAQMQNWPKLEGTLEKMVKIMPENPEAWYDLAAFKSNVGKGGEAIPALRKAIDLSARRLRGDPKARDLLASARTDEHFNPIRQSADFKKLVAP
ncbi:MAG: DUF2723 domain-containing protein [Methylacidiphilales bacterium]|nr:DUF2723 domain-containing protein [Candidatus Methylacidiphilales bacterium]